MNNYIAKEVALLPYSCMDYTILIDVTGEGPVSHSTFAFLYIFPPPKHIYVPLPTFMLVKKKIEIKIIIIIIFENMKKKKGKLYYGPYFNFFKKLEIKYQIKIKFPN